MIAYGDPMLENPCRTGVLVILSFALAACLDSDSNPTIITDPPMQEGSGLLMEISAWSEPFYAVGHLSVDSASGDPVWGRFAGYLAGGDIVAADVGENGAGDIVVLSLPSTEVGEYPFDADCDPEERDVHDESCVLGVVHRGLTGWDSEATERWEFVSGTVTVESSMEGRIEGLFSGTVNRVDESTGEVTATAEVTNGQFGVDLVAGFSAITELPVTAPTSAPAALH
jgi:hypothetical protein